MARTSAILYLRKKMSGFYINYGNIMVEKCSPYWALSALVDDRFQFVVANILWRSEQKNTVAAFDNYVQDKTTFKSSLVRFTRMTRLNKENALEISQLQTFSACINTCQAKWNYFMSDVTGYQVYVIKCQYILPTFFLLLFSFFLITLEIWLPHNAPLNSINFTF